MSRKYVDNVFVVSKWWNTLDVKLLLYDILKKRVWQC